MQYVVCYKFAMFHNMSFIIPLYIISRIMSLCSKFRVLDFVDVQCSCILLQNMIYSLCDIYCIVYKQS